MESTWKRPQIFRYCQFPFFLVQFIGSIQLLSFSHRIGDQIVFHYYRVVFPTATCVGYQQPKKKELIYRFATSPVWWEEGGVLTGSIDKNTFSGTCAENCASSQNNLKGTFSLIMAADNQSFLRSKYNYYGPDANFPPSWWGKKI
ncbi:MAG: hypothetical protein Q8R70_08615 [Methanoregula sp.]|nr:hypothetical protein [Methanoregula sp.]